MTAMGVTLFYNRVQIPNNDKDQLMLLRTMQDNESNIISNRSQVPSSKNHAFGISGAGSASGVNNAGSEISNTSQPLNTVLLPPYDPSRLKKHGKNGQPPPIAVARRNARERNRVKQVNDGFALLRQKIPSHVAAGYGDRGKKLSKVETLRMAVEYIRSLQRLLAKSEDDYDLQELEHAMPIPSPAGSAFSGSTHNGSGEFLSIEDEQPSVKDIPEYLLEMNQNDMDNEKRNNSRSHHLRLSPNKKTSAKRRKSSPIDFYVPSEEDEENVEPNDRNNPARFSPSSVASSSVKSECRRGVNEEHLSTKMIVSPYGAAMETGSETESPEEASTSVIYTSDLQPLLYYKHEISEPGEFVDVVSWWEQEQNKTAHHTQSHVQRLTHV